MTTRLLQGRMYDIAVGRTDLPLDKVATYRAQFEKLGFDVPEYEGPALPPVPVMAKNLAVATLQHTAAGMPKAPLEEKHRRLEICRSNKCGMATLVNNTLRCAHASCGCFLETKAGWADQQCPLGFW